MRRVALRVRIGIDTARALSGQVLLFARAPRALRWRIETFGLYMPSLPDARPWFRPSGRALRAFVRQMPSYVRWLGEMQALRRGGPAGWGARRDAAALDERLVWLEHGYPTGEETGSRS